ncbi:hypothetical protein [Herbaspirillum huttiense]|uniref:hypothetical protein n=1 Tax=Herbaspirillum huttiense TaxID=863372 RepID=UPI003F33FE16
MDYPLSRANALGLYNGKFTNGVPGLRAASVDDADFMNVLVDSLLAVQTASGQTHAESDTGQLVKAILRLIQRQVTLTDNGAAANVYSAANDIPIVNQTLTTGLEQRLVIAHTNTGASTYAPDGLAAKPIYGMGMLPLQGGELQAGGIATLIYSATANSNSGAWILIGAAGGAPQIPAATQSAQALQYGQALGFAQTYQFPSRAAGVTYYNTTTRPIFVSITGVTTNDTSGGNVQLIVNGQAVGGVNGSQVTNGQGFGTVAIVPPGASYRLALGGFAILSSWTELRKD